MRELNRARLLSVLLMVIGTVFCTKIAIAEPLIGVEPTYWWVGMKNPKVQLLLHAEGISTAKVALQYAGVNIEKSYALSSKNYLFVNLLISPNAKAGKLKFNLTNGKVSSTLFYDLLPNPNHKPASITQKDVVYLIMPDRFANGDTSNDNVVGFKDKYNRLKDMGRHGGDIKGIEDNLDYFGKIGVNTIWLNPVIENNMNNHSYHGYAFTNYYKVDARLGSNEEYSRFIQKAHQKKLKVIKDYVLNHIGLSHPWMSDIPDTKWVHDYEGKHLNCNFRASTLTDPHAAQGDVDKMQKGWFSNSMPDLDQRNPELATYLIQNTLWWITYAGLDGIRLDTYPYPDKYFLKDWTAAVKAEYPNFYIVGEIWVPTPSMEAYWLDGAKNIDGYSASLPAPTDFALNDAIKSCINDGNGWDKGWNKVYNVLAHDFVYKNPSKNLIFLDNHDMARISHVVNNNLEKLKLGLAFLYTTRGIPQLYYGTELLWNGDGNNHGLIRLDMPGGWAGDPISIFKGIGLSNEQSEIMNLMKLLGDLRQNNEAIGEGNLLHYVPEDNIYVYFRKSANKLVMVILNGNDREVSWNRNRYEENMSNASMGYDLVDKGAVKLDGSLSIAPFGFRIIELNK